MIRVCLYRCWPTPTPTPRIHIMPILTNIIQINRICINKKQGLSTPQLVEKKHLPKK